MIASLLASHPELGRQLRRPKGRLAGVDLVDLRGTWGVEIARGLGATRELGARAMDLARWLGRNPGCQALLLLAAPRISEERLRTEWEEMKRILRKNVAGRMTLASPAGLPSTKPLPWLAPLRQALEDLGSRREVRSKSATLSRKSFEVVKVLLLRWLGRQTPLPRGELERLTGFSYPTISKALGHLASHGELARAPGRRPTLPDFPRRSWEAAVALLGPLRETVAFVDASGRPAEPSGLLARLRKLALPHVALGGVEAARHWDPHFDLDGTPRLDLTVHAPDGIGYDLGFVRELDPALRQVPPGGDGGRHLAVLVVHRLMRKDPFFGSSAGNPVPWADPVETLLDLHELRLLGQAEELIGRLRTERPS